MRRAERQLTLSEDLHVVLDAVPDFGQGLFQRLLDLVVGSFVAGRDDDFPALFRRE